MKGLNCISRLTTIFAVVFIIYGCTQSMNFEADTSEYNSVLMERTIRTYVFIVGGLILFAIGSSLKLIKTHLNLLENKVLELELKVERK